MIDAKARETLREAIRHLAAGQITNYEFDDRVPRGSNDSAVHQIFWQGAWRLYSDMPEYRLVGKRHLPLEARPEIARWLLFLSTDLEYEWPSGGPWRTALLTFLNLVSLGVYGWLYRRHLRHLGDWEVWPFFRASDLDSARRASPPYLAGAV